MKRKFLKKKLLKETFEIYSTSLVPSLSKSNKANDDTLSPVTVHRTSSHFLLKPCMEQFPPTIANVSSDSPHAPIIMTLAPS